MTDHRDPDEFDRLASAAARVLRAALSGAADVRAAGDRVDEVLRELERAVASVLREAQRAADDLVSRAERAADRDAGDLRMPALVENDVRLVGTGSDDEPAEGRDEPSDVVIRRRRRS